MHAEERENTFKGNYVVKWLDQGLEFPNKNKR